MLRKVAYTNPQGTYRPYLEIVFRKDSSSPFSNKYLAIVDSGADRTSIPYSIGAHLGFTPPADHELTLSQGVGALVYNVPESCQIGILNSDGTKIYVFDEDADWRYPSPPLRRELLDKFHRIDQLNGLRPGITNANTITQIDEITKKMRTEVAEEIGKIDAIGILLGRTFFRNFSHIQFCERDRGDRSKFIYQIDATKIKHTIS